VRARHFAGHHGLGVLLFLLIVALLIGAVVFVAVRLASHRSGHRGRGYGSAWRGPMGPGPMMYGRDPALEHARVRYARGELSRDDYLRLVNDLGGPPPADPTVSAPA
jgi:uncharacterized membrane protein